MKTSSAILYVAFAILGASLLASVWRETRARKGWADALTQTETIIKEAQKAQDLVTKAIDAGKHWKQMFESAAEDAERWERTARFYFGTNNPSWAYTVDKGDGTNGKWSYRFIRQ